MPFIVGDSQPVPEGVRHPEPLAPGVAIPSHLMRPLWVRQAFVTFDEYGAQDKAWRTVPIRGRIAKGKTVEILDEGREGSSGRWMLFTNYPDITTLDRVGESDGWWHVPLSPAVRVWEVDGEPYAVYAQGSHIHHYEIPVRRVEG